MDRTAAIAALRARRRDLKALGVKSLYLFGSTARGTAGKDNDVDLFFDYASSRFDLCDLAAVRDLLAGRFPRGVDVTTRGSLHPRLREAIEREAVKVF
jgi:predicted nucleotidyltransferase